ncbi:helix-turn-helix domain-containing protein [Lactobacillus helveticus]|uniref:helix-turn-helix domain-containing protein n=1 Tax=Lactobacillus helveticus TaxID=1587 RepID=UPI00197B58CE|nr:Rgg/GadR/MutR family transcriptional regulator [Lactobacillus helveticus]MBN6049749.1 helix-turn-helix domain-containing protein [Lactobacillus helveticus]
MTIGELLREYRVGQNKKQKEFTGEILSPSYYSKVEKGKHKITAEDLISLLIYNQISVKQFFGRLDENYEKNQLLEEQLNCLLAQAYFQNDKSKLEEIRQEINDSCLSSKAKTDQLLYADIFLVLANDTLQNNKKLQDKVREKLFSMDEFDEAKIMLYGNSMRFYSLSDNKIISQSLIRKYRETNNIIIQKYLVSLCVNMLIILIENNDLKDIKLYTDVLEENIDNPDFLFYRSVYLFLINFIKYKNPGEEKYLGKCNKAIEAFRTFEMNAYANELANFLKKYK